jgi:hypothetical protein
MLKGRGQADGSEVSQLVPCCLGDVGHDRRLHHGVYWAGAAETNVWVAIFKVLSDKF